MARKFLSTPDGQVAPTSFGELAAADLPSNFLRSGATQTVGATTFMITDNVYWDFGADVNFDIGIDSANLALRVTSTAVNIRNLYVREDINGLGNMNDIAMNNGAGILQWRPGTGTGSVVLNASPTLTGNPIAPTQTAGNNSTRIATTAFVTTAVGAAGVADGDKGDITVSSAGTVWTIDAGVVTGSKIASSVALSGNPTTTTQTVATNNTTIATTAYVDALTALTSAYIIVGNASNVSTGVPMTGDIAITNAGVTSLAVDRWKLAGTSTITADMTVTGAFNLALTLKHIDYTQTFTAGANNDYQDKKLGTAALRATTSDLFVGSWDQRTFVSGAASQQVIAHLLNPTFTATGGAFSTATIIEARGTSGSFGVNSTGAAWTTRGLAFVSGASAGANTISWASGTATLAAASGSANLLMIDGGTSNQTNGNSARTVIGHTFAPVSGSTSTAALNVTQTINQTGTASAGTFNTLITTVPTAFIGGHTMMNFVTSSGVTATTYTGIDYNPTVTSITNHYAALFRSGFVGIGTAAPTEKLTVSGNVSLITAGSGLKIAEGANATMGTATLSGGTIVVNTTKVTANSRIFITVNEGTLTNVGSAYVSARSAGTSFTISSTNVLDSSNVAWFIIGPN